ncbi:hypothetical protein [Phenylobacterium immobile]|uniref:hypothetical protein n=1 Tax=Phenylobacterium immobile TaxID=21 RepID=UPI000AF333C0|nr:hypothetical protein [Phenylobacterium immobile]
MINTPPLDIRPAIVAKTSYARACELYLRRTDRGLQWIDDPGGATRFSSMHDAVRTAMRLPAETRAYGLPAGAAPSRLSPEHH